MAKITIKNLNKWGACDREDGERYSDANLEKIFRGRKSLTIKEVLRLRIPDADKVWVATRPGVMTRDQASAWLDLVITRAVRTHALRCGTESVEEWARRWLSGEDRTTAAAEAARVAEGKKQVADLRKVLKGQ